MPVLSLYSVYSYFGTFVCCTLFCVLSHHECSSNRYLPKVFNKFQGAEGFLFLQDDMILNYWNLLQADKEKLWITNKAITFFDLSSWLHFVAFLLKGCTK